MAFELEWRENGVLSGKWRDFAAADDLMAFVASDPACSQPLHGEFRIRLRDRGLEAWTVVTTAAALARWQPPAPPEPLLTSRWTVEDAVAASQLRHAQRLRSCLEAARDDGLIEPAQVADFIAIFDQAVAGEGAAGRHSDPLTDRPDDIRSVSVDTP
jgi:hypothetical protein